MNPLPTDEEIRLACAQGEDAVLALFHRSFDPLLAHYQALAAQVSQPDAPSSQNPDLKKPIRQGDLYWIAAAEADGVGQGIPHPYVVIQDDVLNRSRIPSVVICALTSNRQRVSLPGNVLLEVGEANLPRQSVVEVSKVSVVDKKQLGEYIGSLTEPRVKQILAGMQFLQSFTQPDKPGE